MATLTGFTRPTDPISAVDIAAVISVAIGKTVTAIITSTDVQVTGASLVVGDTTATQAAITAYSFAYLQYGAPISDLPNMSGDRHGVGVTEHAAYNADNSIAALANKSQTSSGLATGSWAYLGKASTNSSGVATVYLTDTGLSTGTAAFTTVYEDGIIAMPVGTDNYQVTSCVLSGDKKSIAVTLNKISTVLGLLTFSSTAGAGIEVRSATWGK